MVVHVELAGHVAVLHEGVVEPSLVHAPSHSQQLGVVRCSRSSSQETRIVTSTVHVSRTELAVAHCRVRVETGSLALQLVCQISVVETWHHCPRRLLIEMDSSSSWGSIRRAGDILENVNFIINISNRIITRISSLRGEYYIVLYNNSIYLAFG